MKAKCSYDEVQNVIGYEGKVVDLERLMRFV